MPHVNKKQTYVFQRDNGTYYAAPTNSSFTQNVTPVLLRNLADASTWDFVGDDGTKYTTQWTDDQLKNYAMQQLPNGEFYTWTDLNGEKHRDPRVIGMSRADPLGEFAVEMATLTPLFKAGGYAGRHLLNGIARDFRFTRSGNWLANKLINRTLSSNISRFDGTVGMEYFNSPYNWYRYTETPEIEGIKEVGKNVTTRDAGTLIDVPSDRWRRAAMSTYSRSRDGYWYRADPVDFDNVVVDLGGMPGKGNTPIGFAKKYGSAHGNRTQASYGVPWSGTTSSSGIGHPGILEGEVGAEIPFGITRSNFLLMPREEVPIGSRIGFRTGEMPIDNLSWFTQLPNGRFRYNGPVLPYRRIKMPTN